MDEKSKAQECPESFSAQWQNAKQEVERLKATLPQRIAKLSRRPQEEIDDYIDALYEAALKSFLKPEGWPRHCLYMALRHLRTPKPVSEEIIRNGQRLGLTMKPRKYAYSRESWI